MFICTRVVVSVVLYYVYIMSDVHNEFDVVVFYFIFCMVLFHGARVVNGNLLLCRIRNQKKRKTL